MTNLLNQFIINDQKRKKSMKLTTCVKYSAGSIHKSPTATDVDRYNPDISHEPVTARSPQTLNRIRAHLECRATPTKSTAQRTNSNARRATVPGHL